MMVGQLNKNEFRMNTQSDSQVTAQAGSDAPTFPLVGKCLGYGGVIPFIALALSLALGIELDVLGITDATGKLLGYGAVIISFIGAVHWGLALHAARSRQTRIYVYSVIPALAAWAWYFFAARTALFGMAVTIVAMYFVDRLLLADLVPAGYLKMRLHLTVIVALCLLLAAIGVT